MVQRIYFKPKHKFPTGGHDSKFVIQKIPGGKLHAKRVKKRVAGPHAPKALGGQRLSGTKALRECGRHGTYHGPRKHKTVSRSYGGVLTHQQVRERIIRAFLIEEQKIVKQLTKRFRK
eukprot:Sspe_Gene.111449::Locus_93531_Transcript_1_1_Confidence_1.000_Length_474::g.111449::m.111449/K02915/RP-L34e, RPL34; large subunit ribosomal protein L34e